MPCGDLVDIQNRLPDQKLTDLTEFLPLAALAALFVGLSKGGMPGIGALAVPLMALRIDPLTAAALLLPIYLISDAFGLWLYRHHYSKRNLSILIPAGLLGVFIGYLAAPLLSIQMMNFGVALIGIWYCLKSWFGRAKYNQQRQADLPRGIIWGTIAGITSFVSHTGAPPYQMYVLPQKLPKMMFAGTTTITFAAINLAKLPPYLALGQFPKFQTGPISLLIITAVIGAFAGAKLTRILPEKLFFIGVEIALFLLSLRLMWKAIFSFI